MNPTAINALKTLSDLAIAACGESNDPLAAYDAIAVVGRLLAEGTFESEAVRALDEVATKAALAASAIRDADRRQLDFRELLNLGSHGEEAK